MAMRSLCIITVILLANSGRCAFAVMLWALLYSKTVKDVMFVLAVWAAKDESKDRNINQTDCDCENE